MGITDDVRKILQIKIKPRQDSYSDQFSRIFLMKVMFLGAFFTGMNWYNDKINCLGNLVGKDGAKFASSSCWINGLYVYENIRFHNNEIGYYGIPNELKYNGMNKDGVLCVTDHSSMNVRQRNSDPDCKPMNKTFFLQYQYLTFFLVLMGALYYAPYAFFKFVNTDIKSLKDAIKDGNTDNIFKTFFNHSLHSPTKMTWRVVGNFVCKILYIICSVLAFVLTDRVLHGGFQAYGRQYASWSQLNNTMAFDYMGRRHSPKPGDVLLPSFAFCEVYEMARNIKQTYFNKHRVICEMSQHILYQYVLILIWWAMVFGMLVSILGLILLFVDYGFTFMSVKKQIPDGSDMDLTIREYEYLEYIRRKNIPLFGQVLLQLKTERQPALLDARAPPYNNEREEQL